MTVKTGMSLDEMFTLMEIIGRGHTEAYTC